MNLAAQSIHARVEHTHGHVQKHAHKHGRVYGRVRPWIEDLRKTRPCLEAVSQKTKAHGHGTRPCDSPCSAMWTFIRKSYMAATKKHARVDVYTPVWCQVCQLLCQFCQLGDLMELWAGKNRQKNRRWRQKEGYILAGTRKKKKRKKRRFSEH